MKKIIVIAGVTASGKSDLAIKLAQEYNGEIISADSVSVYKKLDIGSAKPTKNELNTIKHHLIDVSPLEEIYSVADFQKDARRKIEEIHKRNKLPIIVGGTGLYINALVYDYRFEEYELIEADEDLSNQELKNILDELDPETSKKIHVNNRKRLLRSVQMVKTFNKPISEINESAGEVKVYDALIFFLEGDRKKLYQRINKRVDKMFTEGLVEEVKNLYAIDHNVFSYQSLNSIGYKEFSDYFLGNKTLEEVNEEIKRNTRRLAKRQITWFKNKTESIKVDIFQEDYIEEIKQTIDEFIAA